jgi:hypothetical protein
VGFKFTLSQTKTPASNEKFTPAREVKIAEPKEDWAEITHSSWSEHSGFIETSKIANIAPPPRLDPRVVPRPAQTSSGPTPRMKTALTIVVLVIGLLAGLYSNGVLDPLLKRTGLIAAAPSVAPTAEPAAAPAVDSARRPASAEPAPAEAH